MLRTSEKASPLATRNLGHLHVRIAVKSFMAFAETEEVKDDTVFLEKLQQWWQDVTLPLEEDMMAST